MRKVRKAKNKEQTLKKHKETKRTTKIKILRRFKQKYKETTTRKKSEKKVRNKNNIIIYLTFNFRIFWFVGVFLFEFIIKIKRHKFIVIGNY